MSSHPSLNSLNLECRPYQRPFSKALETANGSWSVREGLLLRLEDRERQSVRFGEVAPLPAFGSESLEEAVQFIQGLGPHPSKAGLQAALNEAPPTTAFGIWSILGELTPAASGTGTQCAALLHLDATAPEAIRMNRQKGLIRYKLKIGAGKWETEWKQLQDITKILLPGERLRLDPNRSWNDAAAEFWFPRLATIASWIEFIEEPFMEGRLMRKQMTGQSMVQQVPLALDESLSQDGFGPWIQAKWTGYWIIKASILGNPVNWLQPLAFARDKLILSSVFETGIGMSALINLAESFPGQVHGLGTAAYFNDSLGPRDKNGTLFALNDEEKESIWNQLANG